MGKCVQTQDDLDGVNRYLMYWTVTAAYLICNSFKFQCIIWILALPIKIAFIRQRLQNQFNKIMKPKSFLKKMLWKSQYFVWLTMETEFSNKGSRQMPWINQSWQT